MLQKDSFETADWLNSLLFEIFCTRKSRQLIDADQEALLSALTRISREAIKSKLSDYQRESWLFLSSLDLESFSFGDRLPLIQSVHLAYSKSSSLAIVIDISYSGGIKVGLKAAVAMNFRDFAASINFKEPSKFKFILKFDAEPTPRISFMLSDLPAYEMSVAMRSQQMDRVSNLIKLLIGNFVRTRLCFPNYLTILFHLNPQTIPIPRSLPPSIQIANSKQYQSQLRVRLVSSNLNLDNESILPSTEINVMAVLSLGELTCKTEIINAELRNTRWNSIHTFNVFNGLESSPKCLQISLYQVIEDALNHLGRIEIPYPSITPGILDIRTLSLTSDPISTISLEMYLHHMEEDGEKDANWIFWNCPKPPRRKPENEKSIEQVNWDSIKFIISKFYTEPGLDDSTGLIADNNDFHDANSSIETITYSETENLFDVIEKLLHKSIHRLKPSQSQIIEILVAFKLELEDFSSRFNLKRPALSSKALPAHNDRLASLLKPLIKSFIPEAIRLLKASGNYNEKVLRDLDKIITITTKVGAEVTIDSSPDLLAEDSESHGREIDIQAFYGFWGDTSVNISIDEDEGIKVQIEEKASVNVPQFDFEGIFYKPNSSCKTFNLSSSDLFASTTTISTTWEIALHRNRFISFVPLGQSQIFPSFVIDTLDILEIEVIKDRNAFDLGFNADLSNKEVLGHANNGVLRLTLRDEVLDLIGESRSCDQWYCILSCRLKKTYASQILDWKSIDKIWLLPLNLPSLSCPYTLAIRHESQTYSFIFEPETLYRAYCRIKTCWMSKRPAVENGNNKLRLNMEMSSCLSVSSSLTASPQSQKSSISLFSFSRTASASLSSSASSTALRGDPFASKTRFDRLKMSSCDKPAGSDSFLMMTSIDDLRPCSSPFKWAAEITEQSAIFNCTLLNFPAGFISIGSEYICYWSHRPSSTTSSSLFLLPRSYIMDISKSLPNWVSSFSGIILKLKKEHRLGTEPIIFTSFNSKQELELVFDTLLGI